MDNLKALSSVMGQEKAEQVLNLANKYDKYIAKFKKEIDALLDPHGFEVKTGIAFVKKETPKKVNRRS